MSRVFIFSLSLSLSLHSSLQHGGADNVDVMLKVNLDGPVMLSVDERVARHGKRVCKSYMHDNGALLNGVYASLLAQVRTAVKGEYGKTVSKVFGCDGVAISTTGSLATGLEQLEIFSV